MKKIVYISSTGSNWGSEESMLSLVTGIRDKGFNPHVYTIKGPFIDKLRNHKIKYSVFKCYTLTKEELLNFAFLVVKIAYMLVRNNVLLVHANDIHSAQIVALSAMIAKVPSVAHIRSPGLIGWLKNNINIRILKKLDLMIAVSMSVKEELIHIGFEKRKIKVISNAVDLKRFNPYLFPFSDRREFKVLDNKKKIIGIFGRIVPVKGHEFLVRALPEIIKEIPDIEILVVGEDTSANKMTLMKLKELAKDINVLNYINFYGRTDDVPKVLNYVDVLVVPSLAETFGRIVIEAMAMKIPVVASSVGGISEIIENGKNGLLIPPKDPLAIKIAVIELLSNRDLYFKISINGRLSVEKNYSIKSHCDSVLQSYRTLLSRKVV